MFMMRSVVMLINGYFVLNYGLEWIRFGRMTVTLCLSYITSILTD